GSMHFSSSFSHLWVRAPFWTRQAAAPLPLPSFFYPSLCFFFGRPFAVCWHVDSWIISSNVALRSYTHFLWTYTDDWWDGQTLLLSLCMLVWECSLIFSLFLSLSLLSLSLSFLEY